MNQKIGFKIHRLIWLGKEPSQAWIFTKNGSHVHRIFPVIDLSLNFLLPICHWNLFFLSFLQPSLKNEWIDNEVFFSEIPADQQLIKKSAKNGAYRWGIKESNDCERKDEHRTYPFSIKELSWWYIWSKTHNDYVGFERFWSICIFHRHWSKELFDEYR